MIGSLHPRHANRSRCRSQYTAARRNAQRLLRVESLEKRELLSVSPDALVKLGEIELNGTTAADVNLITGSSSLGQTFNNNVDSNTSQAGGTVVTVGSNLLDQYGFLLGGGIDAQYDGAQIVAVYALRGTTTAGANPTFRATEGRLALFVLPDGVTYNQFDPLTWGATSADGTTLLEPIAVWDLKAPEDVVDPGNNPGAANTLADPLGGGPGIFNLVNDADGEVNQISINALVPTASQGYFLFTESTTFEGTTLAGNGFIDVTGLTDAEGRLVPERFFLTDEGLVVRTDESSVMTPNTTYVSQTDRIDALNTIAADLGGLPDLDPTTPATNEAFATAFGAGDPETYNPGTLGTTADIQTTLGSTASPTVQFEPTASIHGHKFNDLNGNGVEDPGEPRLNGWEITLTDTADNPVVDADGNIVQPVLTADEDLDGNGIIEEDEQGIYAFTNLLPGTYRVRETVQSGWLQTTTDPVDITLTAGDEYVAAAGEAGLTPNPDDPLDPDNFFTEIVQADLAFGNQQETGDIIGYKWHDLDADGEWDTGEPGLNGWTIYLDLNNNGGLDPDEPSTVTASSAGTPCCPTGCQGKYTFEDLEPGTYVIREIMPTGWTQSYPGETASPYPDAHTVTVTAGGVVEGHCETTEPPNFGDWKPAIIEGYKWCDQNGNGCWDYWWCWGEPGLNGWTIYIDLDNDGTRDPDEPFDITHPDSTSSGWWCMSEDGLYRIDNLKPGTYVIREEAQPGWTQTRPLYSYTVTVTSGETLQGTFGKTMVPNFGNRPPYCWPYGYSSSNSTKAVSDTQASDTQASDTQASDTQASDTQASDTQASDTQASDTSVANTSVADTSVSSVGVSDMGGLIDWLQSSPWGTVWQKILGTPQGFGWGGMTAPWLMTSSPSETTTLSSDTDATSSQAATDAVFKVLGEVAAPATTQSSASVTQNSRLLGNSLLFGYNTNLLQSGAGSGQMATTRTSDASFSLQTSKRRWR